ncbi:MAG: hypothetical protein FJ405_14270 [Verrucomicrobia bacterium]|nr:hypothetical protein [Verrucomicrobiota bacterium]
MRKAFFPTLLAVSAGLSSAWAADPLASAESAGLIPKTQTFYINPPVENSPHPLNNGRVESLGVSIASNGNVIIGWEDDGSGLSDYEAVWTLRDKAGAALITPANIPTLDPEKTPIESAYRAFYRADNSLVSGWTAWGPKIKANLFGDGIGMGATAFALGIEVPEMADINIQAANGEAGDFPAVQLFNNDGSPLSKVMSG